MDFIPAFYRNCEMQSSFPHVSSGREEAVAAARFKNKGLRGPGLLAERGSWSKIVGEWVTGLRLRKEEKAIRRKSLKGTDCLGKPEYS